MGQISVLPQQVADRIAAGEVVERPASAVRELVDNAIDAGAGRIEVELAGGGRDLIAVADDGCGMGREDAVMAFERHATSKILRGEDLEHIETLGFRGEALAAIAAVSRVELLTREEDVEEGTRVTIERGRLLGVDPMGRARGTTVTVKGLFAGTPARRKFLKSPGTELDHALRVVQRAALARPEAAFRLRQEGKTLLSVPGGQDTPSRLRAVLGEKYGGRLVPVSREAPPFTLQGWVGPTDLHRHNREGIQLFVNRRAVRDPLLARAVLDVYRPYLPPGRFPVAAVLLELPPEEFDVNVHPAKSEVRFFRPRQVRALVVGALTEALAQRTAIPGFARERIESGPPSAGETRAVYDPASREGGLPLPDSGLPVAAGDAGAGGQLFEAGPRALAQYRNTFIIAEDAQGLLIVDQHVAHERLLYERLCRDADQGGMTRQALMFPRPLEVGPRLLDLAEEHRPALERLGFRLESFGGNSLIVREVPAILGREARPDALLEILERLDSGDLAGARDLFDHLLATVACQASVKKGYPLTMEKMNYLLAGLNACESPSHCPHGRAISLRIDLSALNLRFDRH